MKTPITFDTDADIIDIRSDDAFKAVFTRDTPQSRGALKGLLSCLIGRDVSILSIIANEPPPDSPGYRQIRYDISCRFNDGELADIEMTLNPHAGEVLRLEYHLARLFVTQDIRGTAKHFKDLKSTYQISFIGDRNLFRDNELAHNFEYYDAEHGLSLGGKTRIITVELSKVAEIAARLTVAEMSGVQRWAVFMCCCADRGKRELINAILAYEEAIAMAAETMLDFTKEEIEWFRNESKLKYELDLKETIFDAQEEAREKGREEARKENLENNKKATLQMARKMKAAGIHPAQIQEFTGLSPEEITNLNFMPPPADSVSGKDNVKK